MKFIVSTPVLLKQLRAVSGALSKKPAEPILAHVLFEVKDNLLTISATDLQTRMVTSLPVEGAGEGRVAVPAKILVDMLKTLPRGAAVFSVDERTGAIAISAGDGTYQLSGAPAGGFPKIPAIPASACISMPAAVLSDAIATTLFAVGKDELRPAMMGVLMQLAEQSVTFVATDAHKLVRYRRTDVTSEKAASLLLPTKAVSLLEATLRADHTAVSIAYNSSQAAFRFGNTRLVCQLIDKRYPDYGAVIPQKNPNRLTLDRGLFLNALRRVAISADKNTHQVRLRMTGGELHICAADEGASNAAQERLPCRFEGEDMEIGFNAKFLIEMLSALGCSEIVIAMSSPNRPALLAPAAGGDDKDILMLLMPCLLN